MLPRLRHIATCIWCGWREATRLVNSYQCRCPNDGRLLDHDVRAIDDRDELARIARDGQESRRPTQTFSVMRP